jgi:hypothetical protein
MEVKKMKAADILAPMNYAILNVDENNVPVWVYDVYFSLNEAQRDFERMVNADGILVEIDHDSEPEITFAKMGDYMQTVRNIEDGARRDVLRYVWSDIEIDYTGYCDAVDAALGLELNIDVRGSIINGLTSTLELKLNAYLSTFSADGVEEEGFDWEVTTDWADVRLITRISTDTLGTLEHTFEIG